MNLENHMVVGNKDPKPLKCPECGELADGKFVEDVRWCKVQDCVTNNETCFSCTENNNCSEDTAAYECVCGCVFNDEGRTLGHTHG